MIEHAAHSMRIQYPCVLCPSLVYLTQTNSLSRFARVLRTPAVHRPSSPHLILPLFALYRLRTSLQSAPCAHYTLRTYHEPSAVSNLSPQHFRSALLKPTVLAVLSYPCFAPIAHHCYIPCLTAIPTVSESQTSHPPTNPGCVCKIATLPSWNARHTTQPRVAHYATRRRLTRDTKLAANR